MFRQWSLLLLCALAALGHESPEHVVEELTRKIKTLGPSESLYYQRAIEYRALRNYRAAARDLHEALKFNPASALYCSELARVYAANNDIKKALSQVTSCIGNSPEEGRSDLYMTRAEIKLQAGDFASALEDCSKAFSGSPQLEWYLVRSRIEGACGKHADRINHLRQAIEQTGSGLLQIELVEAMLDAGHFGEALKLIEPELNESRWRSSWLIRRARALKGMGKADASRNDLQTARLEIKQRMAASRREASLVADLALVEALLGHVESAKKLHDEALRLGLDDFSSRRFKRLISPEKSL